MSGDQRILFEADKFNKRKMQICYFRRFFLPAKICFRKCAKASAPKFIINNQLTPDEELQLCWSSSHNVIYNRYIRNFVCIQKEKGSIFVFN